jgi:hypothetical protein
VIDSRALRTLLPAGRDGGGWEPVTAGESGAAVFRSDDGARYAKCVPADQAASLEAERDRVEWLHARGVPGARVLDWRVTAAGGCLVTGAVPGVPADRVPAATLHAAWEPIADAVRRLYLSRTLRHATVVWGSEGVDVFHAEELEVAAGIRQPLTAHLAERPELRLVEPAFMTIRQAVGTTKARQPETVRFLSGTVAHLTASGFVAEALSRAGQDPALAAPAPAEQ